MSCRILFGHESEQIDVTNTLLLFQKENVISVPASDRDRVQLFGDPYVGKHKDIILKQNNGESTHFPEGTALAISRDLLLNIKKVRKVQWNNKKSICIVGSHGYIGSALVENLKQNFRGRLLQVASKGQIMNDSQCRKCDVILYFGGIANRPDKINDDSEFYELAASLSAEQLLIYASSAAICEGQQDAKESDQIDGKNIEFYAKAMLEREQRVVQFACKSIALRLGTAIGISSNQRPMLVISMLKSAVFTGRITVVDGSTKRSIVSFEDLFDLLATLTRNDAKIRPQHTIYNVASFNTNVSQIASTVAQKTGATCIYESRGDLDKKKGFTQNTLLVETVESFQFKSNLTEIVDDLIGNIEKLYSSWQNPQCTQVECMICGNKNLTELIDLGKQCLANAFHKAESNALPIFPLAMYRCTNCTHSQLGYVVDPRDMFSDYIYVTGTSQTVKDYCEKFAKRVLTNRQINGQKTKFVLDIACNDGTQLNYFKQNGCQTFGVDPAENLAPLSREQGHNVVVGFWGSESTTSRLQALQSRFDVIVSQNVFAHVPNPRSFLLQCKTLMDMSSDLFIQTSQAEIFQTGEYDTLYHEHLSFFSIRSMQYLAKDCGFVLTNVSKEPIHGVSYVFHLKLAPCAVSDNVNRLIQEEEEIYDEEGPIKYKAVAMEKTKLIIQTLKQFKDFKIVGFGASAKGNTLLSFIKNVDPSCPLPAYIVDENQRKQNLLTPGTDIPVVGKDAVVLDGDKRLVFLILAWNFAEEILQKISNIRDRLPTAVILPFPQPSVLLLRNGKFATMSSLTVGRPIPEKKQKKLLITQVYNQQYLLPFFIKHYAPLFERAIVIDYASTDKTLELFKQLAPSGWNIVQSQNLVFDPQKCDLEVRYYENLFPNDYWKLAVKVTEFLVFPNMDEYLAQTTLKSIVLPSYSAMASDGTPLDKNLSIILQCSTISHQVGGEFRTIRRYSESERRDELQDIPIKGFIMTFTRATTHAWGNLWCPVLSQSDIELLYNSKLFHQHLEMPWVCK